MLERHRQRRAAARARTAGRRLTLMDPLFNVREIVKQFLLLEDHLTHRDRRCSDCIRKHLLTCEALAEEAVSLDTMGLFTTFCGRLADVVRTWDEALVDGADPTEIGQRIRRLRKKLTPLVFDPRHKEAARRVASAYLYRYAHAPERCHGCGKVRRPGMAESRDEPRGDRLG